MNNIQHKIISAIKNDSFGGIVEKENTLITISGIKNLIPELTEDEIKKEMLSLEGVKVLSDGSEPNMKIDIPSIYF